jgi:hypothetical protein
MIFTFWLVSGVFLNLVMINSITEEEDFDTLVILLSFVANFLFSPILIVANSAKMLNVLLEENEIN